MEEMKRKFQISEEIDKVTHEEFYIVKIFLNSKIVETIKGWMAMKWSPEAEKAIKFTEQIVVPRGKHSHLKFVYSWVEKFVTLRVSKAHYLLFANNVEKDLLNDAHAFNILWEDYSGFVNTFIKVYTQSKTNFSIALISIDILAITFEVTYLDKRCHKFRISLFEFRVLPGFLKDDRNYQLVACITDAQKQKHNLLDIDFYNAPRLFFVEDIFDSGIILRICERFHIFYQVCYLNKGIYDYEQFSKKNLHHVYMQANRMKKFWLTFVLRKSGLSRKDQKFKEVSREDKHDSLKVSLYFYFQFNQESRIEKEAMNCMRLKVLLVDNGKILPSAAKEEFYAKLKEYHSYFKEIERTGKTDELKREELEFAITLRLSKPISKFFGVLQMVFSTILDRYYASIEEPQSQKYARKDEGKDGVKIIELESKEMQSKPRENNFIIVHTFKLTLKHQYIHHEPNKSIDLKSRLAEMKFEEISKINKKYKEKKDRGDRLDYDNPYTLCKMDKFPETFIKYINMLLRSYPLRIIDKEILAFVQSVNKATSYQDQPAEIKVSLVKEFLIEKTIAALMAYCLNGGVESSRIVLLKLLNPNDFGFVRDEDVFAEIAFRMMDFKAVWITKFNYGYLVFRLFIFRNEGKIIEGKVDFELNGKIVQSLRMDSSNKKTFDKEMEQSLAGVLRDDERIEISL